MKQKSRLITIIIGFFVFVIPLYFFCYNLNELFLFTQNKVQENAKGKLLNSVKDLENNLNPFNFLKSEFNKIHAQLIPDLPEEIISGIPEDSYINNLYSDKLFEKLLYLTKRFSPIIITMGSNNFEKIGTYLSPELINQIKEEIEKDPKNKNDLKNLSDAKVLIDLGILQRLIRFAVNPNYYIDSENIRNINFGDGYAKDLCIKYLTRFRDIRNILLPYYTDYFNKQTIFPIIKATISKKGIHGYYSLIIPQSSIDPGLIVDSVLHNKKNNITIELIEKQESSQLKEIDNGYEYTLNLPTDFITQIKAYKRLNGKNKANLLKKQFKLKIDYSKELINLKKINDYSKIFSMIALGLYSIISVLLLISAYKPYLKITSKLICILNIIILLPIIGIGIFIWISIQNIDDLIDYNVSKTLHNSLENYYMKNEENNLRRLSSIFEIKRKFANINFEKDQNKRFFSSQEKDWFYAWNNDDLSFISETGNFYRFNKATCECEEPLKTKEEKDSKSTKYHKYILMKYINNLSIFKSSEKDDVKQLLTLSLLEDYMNNKVEENSVGQESISNRYLFKLTNIDTANYYYAFDNQKKKFYFESRVSGNDNTPYLYINAYSDKINPLWFKFSNKYLNSNIGIILNINQSEKRIQWPPTNISPIELNELLSKTIENKDSSIEKIKNSNGSIIKECIYSEYNPFIIGGVSNANYNNSFTFSLNMIFPILLTYSILLLVILTNFISIFINKPIKIFNEAINRLDMNQYGTTINSFSKDEFNKITIAFNEMSIAIKQREQIKRYVSDKLIQSVSKNEVQAIDEGKLEKVTILSSDIRNFTGISEKYEPSVIVEMLNLYFTKMQQAISENGGIIDKYIGDAIQAVFYNEPNKENQVFRAAKAALAMRKALEAFNKEREEGGLFTIQNGIGIDTDIAITGTIGSTKGRKDFSVNGEVVARAASLEAKTKLTNSKILLSKVSLSFIKDSFSPTVAQQVSNSITSCESIASQYSSQQSNQQSFGRTSSELQTSIYFSSQTSPLSPTLITKDFDEESVELIDVK